MTAEERMAYFYGKKRRNSGDYEIGKEKNRTSTFFKIKFLAAIIVFILFLSLDYTGYKIQGIGSTEIVNEVIKDMELPSVQFKMSL